MRWVWEIVARLRGWRDAYDVETGALVVFNERMGLHYDVRIGESERDVWRWAATRSPRRRWTKWDYDSRRNDWP